MNKIKIEDKWVGDQAPAYLVAEIGLNHNGDLDLGRRTIEAAAEAGADAVKFQNYRTEDFILDRELVHSYENDGRSIVESQYEMFKRYEMDRTMLAEFKAHCDRVGVSFHSTPTSEEGIADLVALNTPLLKNGSDYLTHLPLITRMGETGLPTVLSTGMATIEEVEDAVAAFRATGNQQLILLHCTSSYPTPPEDVHLRTIPTIRQAFDCLVGFSDHSWGTTAALGAVSLGACWIEKHFTLDQSLPGPDHRFSSSPQEFASLVSSIRELEACLGNAEIGPTEKERENRLDCRLSCVAANNLSAGHVLGHADIVFHRPGTGVPPKHLSRLIGAGLNKNISAGQVIQLDDLLKP